MSPGFNSPLCSHALGASGTGGGISGIGPGLCGLHRRSLQDVDALGLFHHSRGPGRHLIRSGPAASDLRRQSSSNLSSAASVSHLAGGINCCGKFLVSF